MTPSSTDSSKWPLVPARSGPWPSAPITRQRPLFAPIPVAISVVIAALARAIEEVTAVSQLGLITSFDKELLCKDLVDIDFARDDAGRLVQLVDFLEGRGFDP